MAGIYNQSVSRSAGTDALVPEPLSAEIIQEMPKHSAALTMLRSVPLSSKTWRLPVLDLLPVSYFVGTGNDTGMKQTTELAWKNVNFVVEEVATIIPIPEAYLDDADVPLWDEVRPRMAESAGQLVDKAIFWGTNKPATWGTAIYPGVSEANNLITDGFLDTGSVEPAADFGQTVAALGDLMAQTGYTVNGFVGRPGLDWKMIGLRSEQGIPIYNGDLQNGGPNGKLYGRNISMIDNGSWDATKAQLIGGDFSKAIIGMRQDMTFKMFTEGVISDDNGAVVLNLMQQDAVAMRLVLRLAYAVANPVTIMQPSATIDGAGNTVMRFPFGAVKTA